jgi:hypothetical protein
MVVFEFKPSSCAALWTSSHSSERIFVLKTSLWTRSSKTSAPPPGSDPRVDQILEDLDGALVLESPTLGDLLEVDDFDRGEGLDVQFRGDFADRLQHRGVVVEREPGMESADDVQFGCTCLGSLDGFLADLVNRVLVGALVALLAVEGAEGTAEGADVRVVDVPVDVEPGDIPVHPTPDQVRQCAHGMDVVRLVEKKSILARKPGSLQDTPDDSRQTLVGGVGDPIGSHGRFSVKHGHLGWTV